MDNESMVWLLRKADADVNAMDGHGQTRLWVVCLNACVRAVVILLAGGADVGIQDELRSPPEK
nr:hypothetical protein [Rhodopirellula sp. SWK7]